MEHRRLRAAFPNTDIYLMNYRGYGGSTGAPSESALLADAEALFDRSGASTRAVRGDRPQLGQRVAIHLASVRDVSKLVLVTPYDASCASRIGISPSCRFRGCSRPFDSFSKASKVRAPVLMLLAERDRVIPRAHSERLATAFAPGQVEVRCSPDDHDSIASSPEYRSALAAFLLVLSLRRARGLMCAAK